jgi:hypothetical protein
MEANRGGVSGLGLIRTPIQNLQRKATDTPVNRARQAEKRQPAQPFVRLSLRSLTSSH